MDLRSVIALLNKEFPYEPTVGQRRVMEELASFLVLSWKKSNALFLLSGYAGTGKTTLVKSLVDVLPRIGKRTVLLAPTGRAAKVLHGYTGQEANTIHRKIYLARTTREGQISLRLQTNYHKHTLFIVDETSMIQYGGEQEGAVFSSRNLLDDLFHYVYSGENCRMMFIGDTAQLPPVGLGYSPALDIDFLKQRYHLSMETYELTEVVRQARKSGILVNATMVREQIQDQKFELPVLLTGPFNDIQRITGSELEELLNHAFSGSAKDHNVVICRSNKRANIFNREIRRRILYYEDEISTGDYLMVVKNNYFWLPDDSQAGFIANGDIVELVRIRKIEEQYGFRFAEVTIRFIDYPEEKELDVKIILDTLMSESAALSQMEQNRLFQAVMADYQELSSRRARLEQVKINPFFNALQVKFAYALTCHKTQGGQWNTVFVDQGYLNDRMINIEYGRWLYTALTRATRTLYLINFEERFFKK